MNRLFRYFFLGFFFLSALLVCTESKSYAQSASELRNQMLRKENIEEFKEWRRDIPDFEKRLYDRVKGINSRVIRVQNLNIASFILLVLFNGVFFVLIYRRIGRGKKSSVDPSKADKGSTTDAPDKTSSPDL